MGMPEAPPPDGAVTYILNELTRRLNEVAGRFEIGMGRLDSVYVRKDVYDQFQLTAKTEHTAMDASVASLNAAASAAHTDLEKRIEAMEESRQWLLRLCAGALITALISAAIAVITVAGGK